jgi:hypothetical protein
MMNNPQWNQFQMWLQTQVNMGLISPYLPQQQIYQLYQQYVFNNYGFVPPIPMPAVSMPTVAPQPMSTSMPSISLASSLSRNNQPTENKIKELLPRTPNSPTINMGSGSNILNITLNASTGNKTVINASAETTIQDLLKMYTQKLGLPPNVIGKDIMFLYNGAQLDFKSQTQIGSIFRNTAVITVYDLGGIIGA